MRLVRLGYSCNNACVFCAQGDLRATISGAGEDEIRAQLEHVSGETVAFVGGEPTLYDSLIEWARAARDAGARSVLVQTNGRRLAYSTYGDALAEAGVDAVDISLHGSNAPMHEYHTRVDNSFSQTIAGISNARRAGMNVGVTAVVTRSNFRHLEELVRVAHAKGADAIHFSLAIAEGNARIAASRVLPPHELVQPYLKAALSLARRLRIEALAHRYASSESVRARFAGLG